MVTRSKNSIRRSRRRQKQLRPVITRNIIAFLVAVLHLVISSSFYASSLEPKLMDYWFAFRGERKVPQEIAIVALDERSYRALGLSMLEAVPRALQARLLQKLAQYKVKAVMFDLVFRTPSQDAAGDEKFAETLELVPTFLGKYLKINRLTGLDGSKNTLEEQSTSIPLFTAHARGTVFLNVLIENRIVRRFITDLYPDDTATPMANIVFDKPREHPLPNARDYINYYGPSGSVPTISLSDLLADEGGSLASQLAGKIVFVGTESLTQTGLGDKDTFLTPYSGAPFFGVEIHATIAGNLLDQSWIRRLNPYLEFTLLNVVAFLSSFALMWMRPTRGIFLLGTAVFGWSVLSYILFLSNIFLPGLLLVAGSLPFAFLISTFYYYVIMARSYSDIESALGVELKIRE